MSHPDLFRKGNTSSPKFESVRKGVDIPVDAEGNVKPGTGGVSTFSKKPADWPDKYTFVLKSTVSLSPHLEADNDAGTHWVIGPKQTMSWDDYVGYLRQLNSKAIKYTPTTVLATMDDFPADLPRLSSQTSKSVRFVFNALAAVYHDRIPVNDWDDNDYTYVAVLASALEAGDLDLAKLAYDGKGDSTKAQRFAAIAVAAYVTAEKKKKKGDEDEDLSAEMDNDHAVLASALNLDQEENPLTVYLEK